MGEIASIKVLGNAELQAAALAAIQAAQQDDPLAPVTLIVDSPSQGWALRRQLIRAWPIGTGVANLRALTLTEFLGELASPTNLRLPGMLDDVLRSAVVEATLRSQTGPLAASKDHPDTAVRLSAMTDQLAWCRLDPATIDSLPPEEVSATARAAIGFACDARHMIAAELDEPSWPDACARIVTWLEATSSASVPTGAVVCCARRLPTAAQAVLTALAEHVSVTRVVVEPGTDPITATVANFPDPATECSMAVRLASDAIYSGVAPDRVAIVYPTDLPYSMLLENALTAAGLEWHGPTGQTLQATAVARYASTVLAMATARVDKSSGITRPLLMKWLGLGTIYDGDSAVPSGAIRALIRQEGLYGDATNWQKRLGAMAASVERDDDADDSSQTRRRQRLAPYAAPLAALITRLDDVLAGMATATTWTQLGSRVIAALEEFHLHGAWWQSLGAEAATVDVLRSVLLESFPGIDALRANGRAMAPSPADAAQILASTLASRRGRHGNAATGVHVGPVSAASGLVFKHVIIVGASEGLLPPVRGDDPLLPDTARELLGGPEDVPTTTDSERSYGDALRALANSSETVVAFCSRGALPGRAVGLPSRYLAKTEATRIDSARSSLTELPPPVTAEDLAILAGIGSTRVPPDLAAQVASAVAWAYPQPGPHYGDVGLVDGVPVWSMDGTNLSASGIEGFLHCPYHFFVQRVLGIATDEFEDEIDTMAPKDLGTMLHSAFERLVEQSRQEGTLPDFGGSWPESALSDLRAWVDEQVDVALQAGLTGWRPAWERTYEIVTEALPAFLQVDQHVVRADPPMRPAAAERGFGYDAGTEVVFRVSDDVVVRLRGFIDRVDESADGGTIGIVDYKSGSSNKFAERLGGPVGEDGASTREKVQDLVYDVAARALFPSTQRVDVRFFFVPNNGKDLEVITAQDDPDREASLRHLLARIERDATAGSFAPTPSGNNDYCPVCKRLGRRAFLASNREFDGADAEQVDA